VSDVEYIGLEEAVARLVTTSSAARALNTAQAVLDYLDANADAAAASLLGEGATRAAFADIDVTADSSDTSSCPGEPLPVNFVAGAASLRGTARVLATAALWVVATMTCNAGVLILIE